MSIMDQVKQHLREWYSLAADRTGEMAKISVRMYDKYGISREIERQLSELGSYVYHAVESGRTDFAGDEAFHAGIVRIQDLERDLREKVAEIDTIRRQRMQKAAERPAAEAALAGSPAADVDRADAEDAANRMDEDAVEDAVEADVEVDVEADADADAEADGRP